MVENISPPQKKTEGMSIVSIMSPENPGRLNTSEPTIGFFRGFCEFCWGKFVGVGAEILSLGEGGTSQDFTLLIPRILPGAKQSAGYFQACQYNVNTYKLYIIYAAISSQNFSFAPFFGVTTIQNCKRWM